MKLLIDTLEKTGSMHHVYVIEGERHSLFVRLTDFLKKHMGIERKGNPDFWHGEFETLGIDEGRVLKDIQIRKTFGGEGSKKIIVVSTDFITHEAQNSLLKIFEEPTPDTHFFILMPSSEVLLPTLRSRVFVISKEHEVSTEAEGALVELFLKSNKGERLALLKDKIEDKEKSELLSFLNALERALRTRIPPEKMTANHMAMFEELLKGKAYMSDRSPSIKMIVEYLSLAVPVIE